MFRSISRVFFVLICASGATVAMAANEKIDIDIPIATTCRARRPNATVNTTYADNCASYASKVCYGNNGDDFATVCVIGCQTCRTGYNLKPAYGTADEAASSDQFLTQCTFKYNTCAEVQCDKTCAIGLPQWRNVVGANYQIQTYATLNKEECKCVTHKIYRCKESYYMDGPKPIVVKEDPPASYAPPCIRCPRVLDKNLLMSYGMSDLGNNAGQRSCYAAKDDSYSHKVQEGIKTNTIGKYRLSVDCYYDQKAE